MKEKFIVTRDLEFFRILVARCIKKVTEFLFFLAKGKSTIVETRAVYSVPVKKGLVSVKLVG